MLHEESPATANFHLGPRTKTPLWRVRINLPPGFLVPCMFVIFRTTKTECFSDPKKNQLFCRPIFSSGTNQSVDPLTSRQPQHPLLFCPGCKSSLAELCAQGPQDQLIGEWFYYDHRKAGLLTANKHLRYLKQRNPHWYNPGAGHC